MAGNPSMRTLIIEVEYDHTPSPYRTSHSPDPFLEHFSTLRNSLIANLQGVVPLEVIAKAPPKHYKTVASKTSQSLYLDSRHSRLVHFPRKDSFEVSIDGFVVFSRLQNGGWPDLQSVTEWAFRVTEKMIDLEIEKETQNKQDAERKQQVRKMFASSSNSKPMSPQELGLKEPSGRDSAMQSRQLPALYTPVEQASRNPFPATRGKMRYSDVRKQAEQSLGPPTETVHQGVFRRTQRNIGRPARRLSHQNQTISYSNQANPSKPEQTGFTWNFEAHRDISMRKTTTKVNPGNPRESEYRRNGFELSPLLKPEQRSRVQSVKETLDNGLRKVEFRLSTSVLNCFMDKYKVEGNRVSKKRDDGWWPVLGETSLPLRGMSYLSVLVVRSHTNKVQLGLAPLTYYPNNREDHTEGLLSFDYSTGCVRDSKLNDTSHKTAWRHGGEPAPPGRFLARITIDMDNRFVDWYADEKLCGSAKIPLFFTQGGCRAFLSVYSARDLVLLNDETNESQITTPEKDPEPLVYKDEEVVKSLSRQGSIKHQVFEHVPVTNSPDFRSKERNEDQVGFGGSMVNSFTQTTPNRGRIRRQKVPKLIQQASNTEQVTVDQVPKGPAPVVAFQEMKGERWEANYSEKREEYELYHSSEKKEEEKEVVHKQKGIKAVHVEEQKEEKEKEEEAVHEEEKVGIVHAQEEKEATQRQEEVEVGHVVEEKQKQKEDEEKQEEEVVKWTQEGKDSETSEEPNKDDIDPVAIPEASPAQEEEEEEPEKASPIQEEEEEEPVEVKQPSNNDPVNNGPTEEQRAKAIQRLPETLGNSLHSQVRSSAKPEEKEEFRDKSITESRPKEPEPEEEEQKVVNWVGKYEGGTYRLDPLEL